jgi:ketosteroid isomerase-like protein
MRLALLLMLLPLSAAADLERWRAEVRAAECAFAKSMADRDFAAFAQWVHEDALFFAPGLRRGKAAVLEGWKPFYEGRQAPFSWAPDRVEPLADGSLAWSTGLARDPQGRATNRFTSVWKQVAPGQWRVILDNGVPLTAKEREEAERPDLKLC